MTLNDFSERYTYDASRDLLGEGGFGRVYRAWDNEEHEYVALKMQLVDPMHLDLRLRNEFNKVQQHRHRYIARYKDCYTFNTINGEMDVAVMKYYKDGSLDQLLNSGKLNLQARYAMLRQILEGIVYLHQNNIIHRDLKPQNILIVEHDGRYAPLITDFGISKQIINGQSSAVSNSVMGGTYAYASPEQLKETTIRKNTDLWSFGIIAYIMLTGSAPFNCGTFSPTSQEGRQEQFRQMTSGILPDTINNIPEPWQRLIRECLVVDNNRRIAHAKDALAIINASDSECGDSVDIAYLKGDESTIVEGKTTPDSKQSVLPTNKLYRKYAISALVFALLFLGFGFLSISAADFFVSSYGTGYLSVYFVGLLPAFMVEIVGTISYICTLLLPYIQWLALIGLYASVRGFARAQISPDDASAVRKVSYGVLLATISMAILPIASPLFKLHFFFCELLQYAGIAISIWGISHLIKSQYQTKGARTGLKCVRGFLLILIPLYLFSDLLTTINIWEWETIIYSHHHFTRNMLIYTDKSWLYGLMILTYGAMAFTSLLAIFGIGKIALSRNEVETEPYNALCEANNKATSEQRSLRIWLYGMSALTIFTVLNILYHNALQTLDMSWWDIIESGDYFWIELYYRIFGHIAHSEHSLTDPYYVFPDIITFALALWLLLNNNIRKNKLAMLCLIGMILSTLILPTFLIIGLCFDALHFTISEFGILYDILRLALYLAIICNIGALLGAICTLLFVWCSGFKRYTKVALSITIFYSIITAVWWMAQNIAGYLDWQWLTIDFGDKFEDVLLTISQYMTIAEATILLISAALITSFTKHKWIRWVTIALAAIFATMSIFGYYKIRQMEEQRLAEEAHREKIAELNEMVRDGKGRNGVYVVGDYYNRDGLEGFVFEVSEDGRHGKIVSLDSVEADWDWGVEECWVIEEDWNGGVEVTIGGFTTNATSETDGKANTDKLMSRSDSYRFNAAEWCRNKGPEWYLPAISELATLCNSIDQIRNYEEPENDGYASLWTSADSARQANWDAIYWSSTETSDITADWHISYETVDFGPGDDYDLKCNSYMVRAIAKF